jgi:hypothetical protein
MCVEVAANAEHVGLLPTGFGAASAVETMDRPVRVLGKGEEGGRERMTFYLCTLIGVFSKKLFCCVCMQLFVSWLVAYEYTYMYIYIYQNTKYSVSMAHMGVLETISKREQIDAEEGVKNWYLVFEDDAVTQLDKSTLYDSLNNMLGYMPIEAEAVNMG